MSSLLTIRKEGGSKVLVVTKLLPPSWCFVEVKKIAETKRVVTLQIIKVK
jgi:hypothetical protein